MRTCFSGKNCPPNFVKSFIHRRKIFFYARHTLYICIFTPMEACTYTHTARIEVRYAETDQMGIVHHSVYAVWFEQARTEFFREAGASYADMEAEGFGAPVLELNVQFKAPTHYGDFVDIETTMVREGKLKMRFYYKATVNGKLCTTGSTLHCMTKDGRPTRELPASFSKFEFVKEDAQA